MSIQTRRTALYQLGWLGLASSPLGSVLSLSACAANPNTTSSDSASADYQWVNRLSWGANDTEMARMGTVGRQAWLRQQLDGTGPTDLPASVQARIDAFTIQQRSLVDIAMDLRDLKQKSESAPQGEDGQKGRQALNEEMNRLAHEASTRHLLRALYSPTQLRERLTWFWFNHFNVFQHKHQIRAMLGDYEERALRPHALGNFRDLLGAVLHHPAMLVYLDNEQNAVDKINENLARELMELHTLGVDAGYTQRDVQELARVLTGHGARIPDSTAKKLNRKHAALFVQDGLYSFNPGRHDFGDKQVLGHTIKGRGAAELDQVLDILAAHPATARFVCRKLARAFGPDQPNDNLIDRMATAFRNSDGHIGRTLEAMFTHADFMRADIRHFKDPVHYVVSAVRAAYDDHTVLNTRPMENWINRLGEGLYNRQTPDGYALTSDAWSSSGQMAMRFEIARTIGYGSAGLFKGEDAATAAEQPAFPQLARPVYYQHVRPLLGPDTQRALNQAASPQDWNTLYLSSPEFMYT